jgi:beta-glucosidase
VYSDLRLESTADGFDVSFVLSNTSSRDAEEVAQVYVSRPNSRLERPAKELKGFRRVMVKAGERKGVTIQIRHSDLSDWDEATQSWKLEPGNVNVLVGNSSDHLPIQKTIKIN